MSSRDCDQSSPSANKRYGKKHYVIKLLSRINNLNPLSTQLIIPTSSSIHESTPSVENAIASTPSPHVAIGSTSLLANVNASTLPVANATALTPSPRVVVGSTSSVANAIASTPSSSVMPSIPDQSTSSLSQHVGSNA